MADNTAIRMCSWNVHGIQGPVKRKKILSYLKQEKIQLAFIQETHLIDSEHSKLKRDWVGQVFYSSFTSKSRGVAILVHKTLPPPDVEVKADTLGRYVMVKGTLCGEPVSYLNVYAPPIRAPDFYTKVFSIFSEWIVESSVIAGDFNCCLNPRLDKSNRPVQFNTGQAQSLLGCCRDIHYVDIWRTLHPNDKSYTFYSKVHKSSSRIDYFFISEYALQKVLSCSIGNIFISDHAPLFLVLSSRVQRPRAQWRFPNHLIKNPDFKQYFTEQFNYFITENNTPGVSPNLLWETAKAVIRGFTISFSANLKKKRRAEQQNLEQKLSKLQGDFNANPSADLRLQIDATTAALDTLLSKEAQKSLLFAKHRMYEFGNKPSKYLANLTKAKPNSQAIPVIKDTCGKRIHNNKDINNSFVEFYKNVYNSQSDCHSNSLAHDFLSAINLPQISDAQREMLNKPVTRQEVKEAISALNNNKAPGPDGLTPEFYKTFFDLLIGPLINMLSYSFNSGALPHTMMDANISLILKKGKPAEDCASYRPISLLDIDRKLLAKILARRLESVLPDIISVDQTGFILGRNSSNNIRRLLNLIQHSSGSKAKSLVISLDAEKAFDRIEWPYLLKVLSKFNLGDNFIKWISLLYAAPNASVITNGLRSPAFAVRRGCRQGCPASPLLFALAIEPLAEAFRNDPLVSGIEIGPIHHKISLYCDDVLLFLTDPETSIARAVEIISDFSQFSGYKINYSKSEAMPLTPDLSWSPTCSAPFHWSPSGFVYLGIKITPSIHGLYKANFVPDSQD